MLWHKGHDLRMRSACIDSISDAIGVIKNLVQLNRFGTHVHAQFICWDFKCQCHMTLCPKASQPLDLANHTTLPQVRWSSLLCFSVFFIKGEGKAALNPWCQPFYHFSILMKFLALPFFHSFKKWRRHDSPQSMRQVILCLSKDRSSKD